ncbi:MAG: NADH peroxidase [Oscillospiraceae bacterium]|nr:NADH peroxidase [Oscillospiraceae bacterium]
MKKWVCSVCGYVAEGAEAPERCPICKAPASKFVEQVETSEVKFACEHAYGVYDKTVKNNPDVSDADKQYILESLKSMFQGETAEVGLYLCMARIAIREGYPEIGAYWEKAAWEEAEHAAMFAELLGTEIEPNMTDSTKSNLAWRAVAEHGATQGRQDLAACAKKNNLDAIHDAVHEIGRDEARHGRAFKGLLDRYFGK